jgi:hypothetical protein|tara:strand:- start:138 stop:419 length:282 start_codon:yes stop_codon:yes gene_type:complete
MGKAKQAFMGDLDNYGDVVINAFVLFQSVENQKKFKEQLLDAKLKGFNVDEKEMRENHIESICAKLSPNANLSFSWSYLIQDFFEENQNDSIY